MMNKFDFSPLYNVSVNNQIMNSPNSSINNSIFMNTRPYSSPWGFSGGRNFYSQPSQIFSFPGIIGSSPSAPNPGLGRYYPQPPTFGRFHYNKSDMLMKILIMLVKFLEDRFHIPPPPPPPPEPKINRQELLARIIDNFDKVKGIDELKKSVAGMEDFEVVLKKPEDFSQEIVQLAKDVNKNQDLIDLADWVSNSSGPWTHDRTNDKLQYIGALNVMKDRAQVNKAIDYLVKNFEQISKNGGNATAMERSDIEADITKLNQGNDDDKAIASALTKIYYQGGESSSKRDLITVLANASGNNSSENQTITLEGLKKLKEIVSNNADPVTPIKNYEVYGQNSSGQIWGDPHFVSLKDKRAYDIQPKPGTTVYVLGDKDIRVNGKTDAWMGNENATVFTQMGIKFGADKVLVDVKEKAPTLNGEAMEEGKTYTLDAGKITWKDNILTFENSEYKGSVKVKKVDNAPSRGYIDIDLSIGELGNRSDGISSEGLLGVSANIDITGTVDPLTGKGALGDLTLDDYIIENGDLFGDPKNKLLVR